MTQIVDASIRPLSPSQIDQVGGAGLPVLAGYYALRAGGGALVGAAGAMAREVAGDGLGWDDWDEVATGAGIGALAGVGLGMHGHAAKVLK
ncbi:hypothetical protein ACWCOP_06435 [Maricaulaceae bacterium MS644]